DTFIAGAPATLSSPGAAYIYVHHGTNPIFATWDFQQKLVPGNPINGENFGFSVSIDNNTALVGAPFTTAGGTAYAFVRSGTVWSQQVQLASSDLAQGDNFGFSVAVLGTRAVIGAEGKNSNNIEGLGAAYIFDQSGNNWSQQQKLLPLQGGDGTTFGYSVDIGSPAIIVGAAFTLSDNGTGAAYAFTSSQPPISITSASGSPSVLWPPNHKLVPVTISVTTTGGPATCRIVSVSSNQPINGTGDGNTSPDWVITGDLTVLLRAERAGNIKTDRVYTITVDCTDTFGNSARQNVFVTVPHDQGK
ncbi:MAG: FG-GAP repeat protein, partial [Limisphaerales bacterium]